MKLALRSILFFFLTACVHPAMAEARSAGGMLSWPKEEMSNALGIFVPLRMKSHDVPGLSIAIVKDGRIIYSAAFGKAKARDDASVSPQTLFEGGDLGEAVAAYASMRLVGEKLLFLDAPLSRDLPQPPWLSAPADNAAVTLRHVLTHTSGLGNNVAHPLRRTYTLPGSHFSYSGVGFLYLQHAMEQTLHQPFDTLMKDRVFAPLNMEVSSFEPDQAPQVPIARGHVPLSYPLAAFLLPYAEAFIVILILTWCIAFFMLQRRLELADWLWPLIGAVIFAAIYVWYRLGLLNGGFVVGVALVALFAFAVLAALLYYLAYIVGMVQSRDGTISRGRERSGFITIAIIFGLAIAIASPALSWPLVVPKPGFLNLGKAPNVATSFHTDAEDMARLMIEIMDGLELGQDLRKRMLGECVQAGANLKWCLGLGLNENPEGNTLWVRGATMGFDNLMVMDPARRAGIVILTNSREGGELAQMIARHVLGIETVWTLP